MEIVERSGEITGCPFYLETADEEGGILTTRTNWCYPTFEAAREATKLLVELGVIHAAHILEIRARIWGK